MRNMEGNGSTSMIGNAMERNFLNMNTFENGRWNMHSIVAVSCWEKEGTKLIERCRESMDSQVIMFSRIAEDSKVNEDCMMIEAMINADECREIDHSRLVEDRLKTETCKTAVDFRKCKDSKVPMNSMKAEDRLRTVSSGVARERILIEDCMAEEFNHSKHGDGENSAWRFAEVCSHDQLNFYNRNCPGIKGIELGSNVKDVHESTIIGSFDAAYKERKRGDTYWIMNSDGTLFSLEQEDEFAYMQVGAGRYDNSYAAIFKALDMFVLAEVPRIAWYQGEEKEWWRQQDFILEVIPHMNEGLHSHVVLNERDGRTYLPSMMQNYVFDPGGWFALAHLELGKRSSLLALESSTMSMFLILSF